MERATEEATGMRIETHIGRKKGKLLTAQSGRATIVTVTEKLVQHRERG